MKATPEMIEAACLRRFPNWGEFPEDFRASLRARMKDAINAALAVMPVEPVAETDGGNIE